MAIIEIPPRFRVVTGEAAADARTIVLAPSGAFGDGRHETTRMCVQALAAFAPRRAFTMLDVGSGTGILSIATAKLGGTAVGVEIDEAANEAARENARLNGLDIPFQTTWPEGSFDVVVANILRDILLELAPSIASRAGGMLVLSGLVSTDVPAILARYVPLRDDRRPEIFERDPWRTLVWR
jgi:ribosomal protein L11 methyltransferase